MKKSLLLTAAVVLTAVVFFGCQNPATNVIIKADTAPGVDASSIKAIVSHTGILVHWAATDDVAGYIVYRREVVEGDPQAGATAKLTGSMGSPYTTVTGKKKIPYYQDSGLKDGVIYQYGIASISYRGTSYSPAVSDIVWQDEENFATAQVPAPGSILPLPTAWPTATVTQYSANTPAAGSTVTNYKDTAKFAIKGFDPNYSYSFRAQQVNQASYTEISWNDVGSSTTISFTPDFWLDDDGVYTVSNSIGYNDASSTAYTNSHIRLVVTVSAAAANDTIVTQNADYTNTKLSNKEKVLQGAEDIKAEQA